LATSSSLYPVQLSIDYPELPLNRLTTFFRSFTVIPASTDLNRWLPLVKWLLAIPHYVVLAVLGVAALVCVVIAWFAILFTGQYPRGLFGFVVGVLRWSLRVRAYAFLMVTDQYPPFQFE
jgi:hypothetical protein